MSTVQNSQASGGSRKALEFDRFGLPRLLQGGASIGVELGVAAGDFSRRMVDSGRFAQFFGVDVYEDHHDTAEYMRALTSIGLFAPFKLLRMRFEEALLLFPDESLDFVYVDGYAHKGEDGGATIFSWLAKVKVGGVLAGHDYHPEWPLVVEAVDALCAQTGFELLVTELSSDPGPQDRYPSWAVIKTRSVAVSPSKSLEEKAAVAKPPGAKLDPLAAPFAVRARQALRLLAGPQAVGAWRRLRDR